MIRAPHHRQSTSSIRLVLLVYIRTTLHSHHRQLVELAHKDAAAGNQYKEYNDVSAANNPSSKCYVCVRMRKTIRERERERGRSLLLRLLPLSPPPLSIAAALHYEGERERHTLFRYLVGLSSLCSMRRPGQSVRYRSPAAGVRLSLSL